jgi:hypothetical protein
MEPATQRFVEAVQPAVGASRLGATISMGEVNR